jgi:hypothetical protein
MLGFNAISDVSISDAANITLGGTAQVATVAAAGAATSPYIEMVSNPARRLIYAVELTFREVT